MSVNRRPCRSLLSEIPSLALAVCAPFALAAVFPFAALRPLPSAPAVADGVAFALVTLTPLEERQVRMAARAAWQTDRSAARNRRIDLFADALPPLRHRAVIDLSSRNRAGRDMPEPYSPDLRLPTKAAPPPVTISPQPDADAVVPAFSREELLQLK